jgi:hypothetical protein
VTAKPGKTQRLRLINAGTLVCIQAHTLTVVALDAAPVEPQDFFECVDINTGQRCAQQEGQHQQQWEASQQWQQQHVYCMREPCIQGRGSRRIPVLVPMFWHPLAHSIAIPGLFSPHRLCCRVDVHIKPNQAGVDTSKSYWINVGR